MENILILSTDKYPNGDAGAVRQHALAKLLLARGHNVLHIGLGESTNFKPKIFDGVSYLSFRFNANNLIIRLSSFLFFKERLKRYINNNCYSIIIVVNTPLNALLWLKKYSRSNNIILIHDCVEWYSPEQFKYGKFAINYIVKNYVNQNILDCNFRIIAISRYLQNYFEQKRIITERIPAIVDVYSIKFEKLITRHKIVIQYAGTPGRKDYLYEVIKGFSLLSKAELKKLTIRIIGVTREQLTYLCGISKNDIEYLAENIEFSGRISRNQVLEKLKSADFTFLMRSPVQRYARAGFPTKFVESLATGTPVICNLTSDMGDYIVDMGNSVVVPDCSSSSFKAVIQKILQLSFKDRQIMQKSARETAEKYFDYRLYFNEVERLLKK